jgi:RHS repeat-associated protein
VQYAYQEMGSGANNSRLISMTYPNGRVLNYNYGSGLDTSISRLTSLSDSSGTLEVYSYLGADTVVQRAHPQNDVNLTYIKQGNELNGDAGDQYTGLDRFGRVVDQRWINAVTQVHTDRFQYAYDRDSNALYKNNVVNSAFSELYHASGAGNGYDPLNQLVAFSRGTLSASPTGGGVLDTVASPSHSQSWTLDVLGNWASLTTDGTTQTRTHNQQNEVTGVGSNTLTFDNNGNLTTDETGKTMIYDAWNRLVQGKAPGGAILSSYGYDGLGRRVSETSGGTTRDLYYSEQWQLLEERISGQARVQYVWSPFGTDTLVERDRDPTGSGTLSERLYVQQDANGDVSALVDTSGNVVERYVYDPYGLVSYLSPSWSALGSSAYGMVYLHQGLRLDVGAGWYDNRARAYSPTLGRFAQMDPAGLGPDSNPYRYLANGPNNATDPSGLYECFDAETKATKRLQNVDKMLEGHVNAVIQAARKKFPDDPTKGIKYVFQALAADEPGTGFDILGGISVGQVTKIEAWLSKNLKAKTQKYQFQMKDTWYHGNKIGKGSKFLMFTSEDIANHAISPTIRVSGILMGTDKWGHFFQQGYWYFEHNLDKKSDRDAFGLFLEGKGDEQKGAKWHKLAIKSTGASGFYLGKSYFGMQGSKVSGVISYADMAANEAGYQFYKALSADWKNYTFKISNIKNLRQFKEYNDANPKKSSIERANDDLDIDYGFLKK